MQTSGNGKGTPDTIIYTSYALLVVCARQETTQEEATHIAKYHMAKSWESLIKFDKRFFKVANALFINQPQGHLRVLW